MSTTQPASEPSVLVKFIFAVLMSGIMLFLVWQCVSAPTTPSSAELESARAAREKQQEIDFAVISHRLVPGMSAAQVKKSWGEPRDVTRTTYSGHVDEMWHYTGDRLAHLDNGVLLSFQESR